MSSDRSGKGAEGARLTDKELSEWVAEVLQRIASRKNSQVRRRRTETDRVPGAAQVYENGRRVR